MINAQTVSLSFQIAVCSMFDRLRCGYSNFKYQIICTLLLYLHDNRRQCIHAQLQVYIDLFETVVMETSSSPRPDSTESSLSHTRRTTRID